MNKKLYLSRNEAIVLSVIVLISLFVRFYPAFTNEFPKGSDTFFHMRIADEIKSSGSLFFYDDLTDTVNSYPPVFHILMALLSFAIDPFVVAKFLGPLLGFLSVLVFFIFVQHFSDKKTALGATFIYGLSNELISKSVFSMPENFGLLLIFVSLYLFAKYNDKNNAKKRDMYAYAFLLTSSLIALTHILSFIMLVAFLLAFFGMKKNINIVLFPAAILLLWVLFVHSIGASSSLIFSTMSLDYILFGFSISLFVPIVLGLKNAVRIGLLLPIYAILLLWMIFIPIYPERIFMFSIIPGSFIAGLGFKKIMKVKNNLKYIPLFIICLAVVLQAVEISNPFGYTKSEMTEMDYEALKWIKTNIPDGTIAGSWQVSGVWINTVAEKKTILGAFQESIKDYAERRDSLDTIFTSSDKMEIQNTMKMYNASYIFINNYEDLALYNNEISNLRKMFPVVMENEYTHIFNVQ